MEPSSKFKTIIIENEKESKNELLKILIEHKCKVDIVSNEKNAVKKIISNYYNCYFIDVAISGVYLINLIKQIKEKSKIIAISSDPSFSTEEKIREAGITYFLKKPFLKKEVTQLIDNLCEMK